jgi:DNA-binding GntR family transcriptional regulator
MERMPRREANTGQRVPAAAGTPRGRRNGASAHTVNALIQAIRDGVYRAGDRLVESRLTRELGVSRGTLREAFRHLAADGVIRLEANRGAVVRPLTRQDVAELLEVREVLEGLAAGLAARRIGLADHRARVQAALERIAVARRATQGFDYVADNAVFHETIIELSGNRTLGQQIRQLQLPYLRARYFGQLNTVDWTRSLNEHEQILLAIVEGDAALAEQLMSAHIRRTRRQLDALPEETFDADPSVAPARRRGPRQGEYA